MDSISNEERMELASLNLRAGMKASENAAFDSAAVYFKAGIVGNYLVHEVGKLFQKPCLS